MLTVLQGERLHIEGTIGGAIWQPRPLTKGVIYLTPSVPLHGYEYDTAGNLHRVVPNTGDAHP